MESIYFNDLSVEFRYILAFVAMGRKVTCKVCIAPEYIRKYKKSDTKQWKDHIKTPTHVSIFNMEEDQIDKSKIREQNDPHDEYHFKREEHKRRKKINKNKPWIDVRFHKPNKNYGNFCEFCEKFMSKKHENSTEHWKNLQKHFMSDLKECFSKSKSNTFFVWYIHIFIIL